ncbi:hypothetical protein B5C34_15650 [Pacificimonas flava]|uniref:HTH tetR-type domain-containing protein n=2 Tax=Pacificimonas TaxID=1960290 RepID=A0A219B280_9SPHN|nr:MULTISPECIES: TetR/AcrR family transcriptional regulator [Pacificimonas]MBZ6379600.1 TetR/AcrR family transcriptional regulator [Pacificimonas aurantium]OWV31928.1 hypothetical protein B5C34_15650 [Pacificimonas flava]
MSLQEERLLERRTAMLGAARELFIAKGFDDTSLTEVVKRSGGSLATLYKLFGNKEGLLLAVLVEDPERLDFGSEIRILADQGEVPADILLSIGLRFAAKLSEPGIRAIMRIMIGQSIRDEDWAARFDALVSRPVEDSLTTSFECWQSQGAIDKRHDPRELAGSFLSLIVYPFEALAIRGRSVGTDEGAVRHNILRFIDGCFADV